MLYGRDVMEKWIKRSCNAFCGCCKYSSKVQQNFSLRFAYGTQCHHEDVVKTYSSCLIDVEFFTFETLNPPGAWV
jgi:hypothetical protein